MVVYADTSYLLSLYTNDAHHAQAITLLKPLKAPLVLTPFQRYEVRNAIRLQVFRRDINPHEEVSVLHEIEQDVQAGFLRAETLVWGDVFEQAEKLSSEFTAKLGTRGMDVLHVATAMVIGAPEFFTFDLRQKALATKAGLKVLPA
jgi:predicted nucleic acid-binding protein